MDGNAGGGRTARLLVLWGTPRDPEAFDRYYRDVHVPLGRKMPGLRRYTLAHGVSAVRGEPCHLVAELVWDSMDELRAAFDSPEGKATAADVDELQKLAPIRSVVFGAGEDVL
jgi:uncharacterized protein (TIGR02118 family)